MKYNFSIEGGLAGNMGIAVPGIPMKSDGLVDGLPKGLQEIIHTMVHTPENFQDGTNEVGNDEAINKLSIEDGGKQIHFQFPDTQIPDHILPLVTYLRKKSYGTL